MKKISLLFLSLVSFYLLLALDTKALTKTPTPTQNEQDERIKNIIEKVASKAAKMDLVEIKGILGTVTDISDTQITLADLYNNTRFVDVDELTKFSSPSAKESFGISDIQKGTSLGILGRYNKQSRRILARFVSTENLPLTIRGQVVSVDEENFQFEALTSKEEKFQIDVEKITKTSSYTKKGGLIKSGFSKIEIGQRFIAIGFKDLKEKDVLIVQRIILFPELPPYPTIVPSTGSGKKLTPIKK